MTALPLPSSPQRAFMKTALTFLICLPLLAQRPSNPALLVPQNAPEMDYRAIPDPIEMPPGSGAPSATAFDSKGHMFVLTRGSTAFFEFDAKGKFLRSFGEGLYTRSHGLYIDEDDNLWATDVGGHIVQKLNPQGRVLLTLGIKGQPGEWNEAAQSRKLNEPSTSACSPGTMAISSWFKATRPSPRTIRAC